MSGYYIYLISSLPMLHFGNSLPFSTDKFFKIASGLIPDEDLELLKSSCSLDVCFYQGRRGVLKKWCSFNIALNNELVKVRALRKHIDPARYLRPDGYIDYGLAHIALASYRNPSLIEAEKTLDQARWNFLDELLLGHYFDLEVLLVYLQKLRILERWEKIRQASKQALKEEVSLKN